MMRLNTLICVFCVFNLFFGSEIQARWIFVPPLFFGSEIQARWIFGPSRGKVKISEKALPKELPYKSDQEFYESYCGFLQELNLDLKACQNADTWGAKYQEIKLRQKMEDTTTTANPLQIIRL